MRTARFLERLVMEPFIRFFVYGLLRLMKPSAQTRAVWGISPRPAYLLGTLTAAKQAKRENARSISVIEFGVAEGRGLLQLQEEAAAVEKQLGVEIRVYGFDAGAGGQPVGSGDYRDLSDIWETGDFPMNEAALRERLSHRTTLILGDVAETVPNFFDEYDPPPIGFISFDMELYSATREALKILVLPNKRMLRHVPLYIEDINGLHIHRFAGALLAIEEFNQENSHVKVDRWYQVARGHAFPERLYFQSFYVAHDLQAISKASVERDVALVPLPAGLKRDAAQTD